MLWHVQIEPVAGGHDSEGQRVASDAADLGLPGPWRVEARRGFLVEGSLSESDLRRAASTVLADPVAETFAIRPCGGPGRDASTIVHVLPKAGVTDPEAESARSVLRDLGFGVENVRTVKTYRVEGPPEALPQLIGRVLANDAVEQAIVGALTIDHLGQGRPYQFQLIEVPLRGMDEDVLVRTSREGQLSLSLAEMKAIQAHFTELGRDPTDCELETLAQTWSEHCSHKTLKGRIEFQGEVIDNLLKQTIFKATQDLGLDWLVSVFEDNAGVVRFDDEHDVCFKVETHNHPSAIDPYAGANTGLGGVIRDVLGTGLAAKPIANTDVFCVAPPDTPAEALPPGVLHPRRVLEGVVAGVRDYGNRMGIPTVNGAVATDPGYLANPLVFCGTVGVIPRGMSTKRVAPGDRIVALGGRTGRDGIHGATFSSVELTGESEDVSGGAVQIGNAITEKMVLDAILQARDLGLFRSITDCGAGGFSSAVGEMGADLGAEVDLEKAPLKYEGLSYTEIWISEAQERMVLAVPPEKWPELKALCDREMVEATDLGRFVDSGLLTLRYEGHVVADLSMKFLHEGRPRVVRQARWTPPEQRPTELSERGDKIQEGLQRFLAERVRTDHPGAKEVVVTIDPDTGRISATANREPVELSVPGREIAQAAKHIIIGNIRNAGREGSYTNDLLQVLRTWDVASKEWIIRQYDHEVQGRTVVKPLVGINDDGPGDAAVILPVRGSSRGLAIGCGINPRYGALDPYAMATCCIDEAVRNCVAVGADPERIALLDNFCWGNPERPETLGSLVLAAKACHDLALAYGTPFISGKDSLYNEYTHEGKSLAIPPTLLISAIGQVPDVTKCVTMDLKEAGNALLIVGMTRLELRGSSWNQVRGVTGGRVPRVEAAEGRALFRAVHQAIADGLVRSCHDLSEGGLAVALAEMAIAGGLGIDVHLADVPRDEDVTHEAALLFSESPSRFLLEVPVSKLDAAGVLFQHHDVPTGCVGTVCSPSPVPRLTIWGSDWTDSGENVPVVDIPVADLKAAWQRPLHES